MKITELLEQIYKLGVYVCPDFVSEPMFEDFKDFYGNSRITLGCDDELGWYFMSSGNAYLLSDHGVTWSFNREELLHDTLQFRLSEYSKNKTLENSIVA